MALDTPLDAPALDQLFREARTYNGYLDKSVSDAQLNEIWGLMKFGPTSANCLPARLIWCTSDEAKEKLAKLVAPTNADKILKAPVSVIIGMDMEFYEQLPELFPHADAKSWFVGNEKLIEATAFRNSSLQGAYFIMAARALGLDTGPMSGFNNAAVDEAFFASTKVKSNFISTLGYGDALLASQYEVLGRGHAERLLPVISELPDRGRADRILVNVGPGSFTGIRVGVAAARALGMAWGAQVSGYGCLELVAAMARAQVGRAVSVDVIMAGGHGEYFYQSFDNEGLARADAESLAAEVIVTQGEAIAGAANAPVITETTIRLDILPDAACWHLIAHSSPLPASPIYGRAPDAKLPKGIAA